ncbi:TPA: aminotransferase class I/II-fold pyridoxal phosphate-dependent enzyme [Streptococcus suis]|uniref:Aminotransferase n=1 Tax=Streptococcus suis TaxID=1307 RepID=A0A1P8VQN0_STRSU|nr:aminotransferase class I/II-fold pyridoxal phosphate-dependent enzyme [Streptococcus suis]APZ78906.1 Aminotransferase [Streptococcus suis]APZ78928.1 Aminotransferase [Streptococcus suis]APZ78950.1 Aminotransferase [Streptococcus suis]MCK3870120.1 aminotransferase class I/II-fold pyridoxal phosphate-dependent enzyme [Streptococcus suis]MDE1694329.1 aminotransferase class I/II-fold pyridoxal phosphate-dependent enzyme [Streptococcus suis]
MAFDFSREVEPFKNKVWLASPTMHGDELEYMKEAYDTNWMTTAGSNINALEEMIKEYTKSEQVVALSSGTSALHLAMKLAGIKAGDYVFCSDVTFSATVNPIVYEGGIPVFIDSEYETWNMDPDALEKAFEIYPNVKVVVLVHLYGVPAKIDEIRAICDRHGAVLIEDAAESLGATYKGQQTGTFGKHSIISFNGNKIITGSSGGALLTSDLQAANKVRKWSTQAREQATWYQHEEIGYNYRMSNVIAGVVRGQMPYLDDHIAQKKAIYERYQEGLKDLPIKMNPFDSTNSVPNYWLSCLTINTEAMAKQVRSDSDVLYTSEKGKTTPSEILDALNAINAEGRPIWKPMHSQPIFRMNPFITKNGNGRAQTNAYIMGNYSDVGTDLFERGLCLPSDNKMTVEEQNIIIETIRACFE